MVEARWLTTRAELAAVAAEWDAALEACGSDNPFLLSDFLLTWLDVFWRARPLRIFTLWSEGRLVGGLPLYPDRRRHGAGGGRGPQWAALRTVGLGSTNLTEPFALVGWGEFADAFFRALQPLEGWTYLSLPLGRTPWWEEAGPGAVRFPRIVSNNQRASRVVIDRPAEAYLQTLHAKMRQNLRRDLRRAEAMGRVELRRAASVHELETLIAFQLRHNGPDRNPPDEDLHAPDEDWNVYTERLLRVLFAAGRLDAMGLWIGGELAAAGFGIRYGPGFKSLLISHNRRFAYCAPGIVLRYKILDWCWEQGDPYLHMYGDGADAHKAGWCHELVPMYRMWMFNRTLAGWVMYWGTRRLEPEPG